MLSSLSWAAITASAMASHLANSASERTQKTRSMLAARAVVEAMRTRTKTRREEDDILPIILDPWVCTITWRLVIRVGTFFSYSCCFVQIKYII